jgi:tetratricopeptide (TPR) repeat protein
MAGLSPEERAAFTTLLAYTPSRTVASPRKARKGGNAPLITVTRETPVAHGASSEEPNASAIGGNFLLQAHQGQTTPRTRTRNAKAAAPSLEMALQNAATAETAHDTAAARRWYLTALQQDPTEHSALLRFAVLVARTHPDTGMAILERWLARYPDAPQLHAQLAEWYAEQQAFAKAETALRTAIDLDPATPLYHYNLAAVYDTWQKIPEARAQYAWVLAYVHEHPDTKAQVWASLGTNASTLRNRLQYLASAPPQTPQPSSEDTKITDSAGK